MTAPARPQRVQRLCKECGQPTKPGRHKPGEYEHAQGCQKQPKERVVKSVGLDGRMVYMTKREEKAWRKRTRTEIRDAD